ncbi:uncharacterized protein V6R79_017384 [Siganus canaliculatus]
MKKVVNSRQPRLHLHGRKLDISGSRNIRKFLLTSNHGDAGTPQGGLKPPAAEPPPIMHWGSNDGLLPSVQTPDQRGRSAASDPAQILLRSCSDPAQILLRSCSDLAAGLSLKVKTEKQK